MGKLRPPEERKAGLVEPPRVATTTSQRRSNGLKDFLWLMPEAAEPRLLDLGPAAQSTISFFIDRGFNISIADMVRSRAEFDAEVESERRKNPSEEPPDPTALAERFLATNLKFEPESFHGILAWDAFDFLETEMLGPLVARMYELLARGGVLLAAFHDSAEVESVLYRVRDTETVDLVPARHPQTIRRVFQNREILALFAGFRSSRTYVGRDHLREALFLK
ncbi:MAG: class I SAM-dependent methyltransferase [Acidobacteriota bacterium]|nr:class I SAM-dependent methyltransferase [Acidobacteriota bacterium]